jgi:hypothetical protein
MRRQLLPVLSLLLALASGSAHALFRTYLSSTGNDANPCTLLAPCRLLPVALAATDPGGEIWMLDSANFNTSTVVINKSVTILAVPGQLGSVVGNPGNAFTINGAGIAVTLQNLNILNLSGGDIGVHITNAATVSVINCNIFGFGNVGGLGIWSNTGGNATKLTVVGSTVRNNYHGIIVAGNGRATISKTHVLNNQQAGIWSNAGLAGTTSIVHVSDSVASGNAWGYIASGSGTQSYASHMYVTRSLASENLNAGFLTDTGSTAVMVVGDSMSTNNERGFQNVGGAGTFRSRGNNTVAGNNTGNTFGNVISAEAGI